MHCSRMRRRSKGVVSTASRSMRPKHQPDVVRFRPLDWARIQDGLGIALTIFGRRESGTAKLEEAVATFREALKERTRERVPLEWATTQTNLGAALFRLGERDSGTAKLKESVAVYRQALQERTRERAPLEWAAT